MVRTAQQSSRRGFTLVEMLVAVALVLLMMTMFAQIFSMATGAITIQRSLANNDQKSRSVTTVIRADLDKRTFRSVIPFFAGEDANVSPNSFDIRQGYFSVSVNNADDGSDDVLALTVSAPIVTQNKDESPYYGRATQLFASDGLANVIDLDGDGDIDNIDALLQHPNQPEADDARVEPDGTAEAPAAEIVYFMRGPNLYRRVLLIRKPLDLAGSETQADPQLSPPISTDPSLNLLDLDNDPTTPAYYIFDAPSGTHVARNNFWGDFDFSAFRHFEGGAASATTFHGIESLNNELAGSTFFSLGKPAFRFGHNTTRNTMFGLPREFTVLPGDATTDVPFEFMGRFLHEETSYSEATSGFGYPQSATVLRPTPNGFTDAVGHPMDTSTTQLTMSEERHLVQEYTNVAGVGGARRSEELLLAGVHEFRVEIWDDRIRKFVKPGHLAFNAGEAGDYHANRRWNTGYGPLGTDLAGAPQWENRVLDSWHPSTGVVGSNNAPPFRAMEYYPPVTPDGPSPAGMPGPFATNSGASAYWTPDTVYTLGDIVFPRSEDANDNGQLDAGEDGTNGFPMDGTLQRQAPSAPFGFTYHYRCVQSGRSRAADLGAPDPNEWPSWQTREGALVSEDSNTDGNPGQAQGTVGAPADGEPIWIAVPNLRPVRAIRITLRFLDQGTETMRQVSITHSLMN